MHSLIVCLRFTNHNIAKTVLLTFFFKSNSLFHLSLLLTSRHFFVDNIILSKSLVIFKLYNFVYLLKIIGMLMFK